jgi:hypothetical protein
VKVLKKVALSYSAVPRRLQYMSCNTACDIIKRTKSSQGLAMQVDVSTDVADIPVLHAFVTRVYI